MPEKIIIADNIVKTFDEGQPNEVRAVQSVSLCVFEGEIVAFRGPSGSGKTTLLSLLGGMCKPTSGEIIVCGERITKWSEHFLTMFRRKHIGFVFQNFNLIEHLTAYQNITVPAIPLGLSLHEMNLRVHKWAEILRVDHRLAFPINLLSGGEIQRVAIARALVAEPELIFADEPTAHLDTKLSNELIEIFSNLKDYGKTLLIATHDPIVYGSKIVNRIIDFRDGHIVESGT